MADKELLKVGDVAPVFSLASASGGAVSLSGLEGKWVVLYFYPKDNTSGCTTEALEFTELRGEFEKLGAVVFGVSKDSVASHKKFIDKKALGIELLSDEEGKALESYGAWQLKKQCGKECMGIVRSTYLIDPSGKVAGSWPKVTKAAGHAAKVLEELKSLVK